MKKVLPRCLVFLSLIFFAMPLKAQEKEKEKEGAELLRADAEGKHFIVGFMQNEENRSRCALSGDRDKAIQQMHITGRTANTVTVNYPDGTSATYRPAAKETIRISLEGEEYECLGEGICNKSIEVIAEEPISLYCFSSKTMTTDGYLALPVGSWGTDYVTANYSVDHYKAVPPTDPFGCNVEPRRGEFAVIAAEDNTSVTIYPAVTTASGAPAGLPMTQTLMKGEIWQVQDGGNVRGGTDLTGSRITADKPVGVLSGHERTAIPWAFETKDHLIEMLPPVEGLGTEHVVIPFAGRAGGDLMRVIAAEPGQTEFTVRTLSGSSSSYTLSGAGTFHELPVTQAAVVESDKPVLVAHYSQSNELDIRSRFDPYMIVTVPTEQFANASLFQTMPGGPAGPVNGMSQFEQHYLTVVFEAQGLNTMRLNDLLLIDYLGSIVAGGEITGRKTYYWRTLRLPGGESWFLQGHKKFSGYVYGIGQFDSYGWPIGAAAGADSLGEDLDAPSFSVSATCGGGGYRVDVNETDFTDYGVARVYLDTAGTFNVRGEIPHIFSPSPPATSTVNVALVDPSRPGRAGIIAVDLLSNTDTIYIELEPVAPDFPEKEIRLLDLTVKSPRRSSFTIANHRDRDIVIESTEMASGTVVTLTGIGPEGIVGRTVKPGESYELSLEAEVDRSGTFRDTLIVVANCYTYRIPVTASAAGGAAVVGGFDFGLVPVDSTRCADIPITNVGTGGLTITELVLEGPFSADVLSLPPLPIVLEPGKRLMVPICYTPPDMKEHIGTIWVTTNGGTTSAVVRGIGMKKTSGVDSPAGREGSGITVLQQGNELLLESNGVELGSGGIRLVALNGETISLGRGEADGPARRRVSLPADLSSGLYYLRIQGRDGAPITAKIVVMR